MSAISQLPAVTAAGTDRIPLARLSSTDVYTAGTISAAASDNSLNDSAASFPGWLVPGLRINIAAFTGDTDNNHDSATVVSATTAKVVLGADTPLVDDAAGESVTITAWRSARSSVQSLLDLLLDAPPGALDTLNELAAALGDDANFATTVTNALALKAPLASPALTGNPTAPTQSPADNSTKIATTAYVEAAVAAGGGTPPVAARYTVDLASQTDGDPGAGKLRFNNATAASATKIFLDDETSDGVDLSTKLLDLGSSGYIRIQSVADVGEWLVAKWTALVDDTGYFDIAITVLASKGTLDDTDAVLVTFDAKGSGSGGSGSPIFSLTAFDSAATIANSMTPYALANGLPVLWAEGASTNEAARFFVQFPDGIDLSGGVDITILCTMQSATSGNVRFGARFMRLNADISVDSFDTAVEAHVAVAADIDDITTVTLAAVPVDGAAAGEQVWLEVYRDASDTTNDTATGAAFIHSIQGRV
jgi:hypothetical protein